MATLCSVARTNYFRVVDVEAFKAWIKSGWVGEQLEVVDGVEGDRVGKVCLLAEFGWPETIYDEENEEYVDLLPYLQPHIAEGEIVIVIESGNEKLRYCYGKSLAFTRHGVLASVSTGDIYELVGALLHRKDNGAGIDQATY